MRIKQDDDYTYYCTDCMGAIAHEDKTCPHCGADTSKFIDEDEEAQDNEQSASDYDAKKNAFVSASTSQTSAAARVADILGRLIWGVVFLVAGFSLLNFVIMQAGHRDMSAPQLAALAADSLAMSLLPYAIARAWDEVFRPWRR